jgi:hypothetical protein
MAGYSEARQNADRIGVSARHVSQQKDLALWTVHRHPFPDRGANSLAQTVETSF